MMFPFIDAEENEIQEEQYIPGCSVDLVPTTSLDQRFLDSIRDDEVLLYEAS